MFSPLKKIIYACCIFATCTVSREATAQFTLSGQLRTRTELRDGQGSPLPEDAKADLHIATYKINSRLYLVPA